MSNEELVSLIQAGETERIPELWAQVERLVKKRAWLMLMEINRPTIEVDDLVQSGFIAFLYAVERYDPAGGAKFSTYLCLCLKNAFGECLGIRTEKQKNDPINWAVSLSRPLADDKDSGKLFDIVPDPDADIPMETVEVKLWHDSLREAMEKALSNIPEQYADVLRMRHYQGLTLAEVGEIRGVAAERVRQMESKGLRLLRQPKNACNLLPFYRYDFYAHTGLTTFRQSGLTVQERYLIAVEDQKVRAAARRQQREQRQREEKARDEHRKFMEQLQAETDEIVARMTPEEKRAMLEKYGYA